MLSFISSKCTLPTLFGSSFSSTTSATSWLGTTDPTAGLKAGSTRMLWCMMQRLCWSLSSKTLGFSAKLEYSAEVLEELWPLIWLRATPSTSSFCSSIGALEGWTRWLLKCWQVSTLTAYSDFSLTEASRWEATSTFSKPNVSKSWPKTLGTTWLTNSQL